MNLIKTVKIETDKIDEQLINKTLKSYGKIVILTLIVVQINFPSKQQQKNGTSFIEFKSHEIANKYIKEFNNKNTKGNSFNVSLAKINLTNIKNNTKENQNGSYLVRNNSYKIIIFYLLRFLLEIYITLLTKVN